MNIGYICGFPSYPPRNGGTIHVYNLIRSLRKLGCTIHTLGEETNPDCLTYPLDADGIRALINAIDVLCVRVDGTAVSRDAQKRRSMRLCTAKPIVWEINAPAEERLWMLRTRGETADERWIGRMAKSRMRALRLNWRVFAEESWRRRQARLTAAAICVSNPLKVYAQRYLGIRQCTVVPNGSDPELFDSAEAISLPHHRDEFKVLYAGDSRWPWQGFDLIDELADRARRDGHRIVFIVLSNTPVTRHPRNSNVIRFDSVPYWEVPRYVAAADACLCVYRDFSWSRHGFYLSPLKLFDYMAAGKAVVASRQGQLAEIMGDGQTVMLVENTADAIYEKLMWCAANQDLLHRFGQLNREKVRRYYNWERVARSTLDVLGSVLTK